MEIIINSIKENINKKDQEFTDKFSNILLQTFSKFSLWQSKLSNVNKKLNQGLAFNKEQFSLFINRIADQLQFNLNSIIQYIDKTFQQMNDFLQDKLKELDKFNFQYEQLFSVDNFKQKKIVSYTYDFYNSFNNYKKEIVRSHQVISKVIQIRDKIFVGCFDKSITAWNLKLDKLQRIDDIHQSWIRSLVHYNNGNQEYLLSCGDDQKYCIFQLDFKNGSSILQTNKIINTVSYSRQAVYFNNHIISPGGQRQNHDLLAFNLEQNQYTFRLQYHRNMLFNLKVLSENCILSTDQSGYTIRWKIFQNSIIKILNQKRLNNLSCSDYDDTFNYFGTETGKVVITTNKSKIIRNVKLSKSKILHIQQIDNQHLIFICKPDYFCLYDLKINDVIKKVKLSEIDEITAIHVNIPYGNLILGDKRGRIFSYSFEIYLQIM